MKLKVSQSIILINIKILICKKSSLCLLKITWKTSSGLARFDWLFSILTASRRLLTGWSCNLDLSPVFFLFWYLLCHQITLLVFEGYCFLTNLCHFHLFCLRDNTLFILYLFLYFILLFWIKNFLFLLLFRWFFFNNDRISVIWILNDILFTFLFFLLNLLLVLGAL